MSVTYVPVDLRRLAAGRAGGLCEYCLIAEDDTFLGCQVDHIISEKHGGPTDAGNLAYACCFCNRAKGSDVGSIDWESGQFVRFFNPRTDRWPEHFWLVDARIEGQTPIGVATVRIFAFNADDRLLERRMLQAVNRYPSEEAARRMGLPVS